VAVKKSGRGGKRPGAGRPRTKPIPPPAAPRIPWEKIRTAARTGAPEEEIIVGLELPQGALDDPASLLRFREEIAKGHAAYKLELRQMIRSRGLKGRLKDNEVAGSVNALGLQARNILDWDKQIPAQETEPDLGTARERLKVLLSKAAKARSDIEGKIVTVLDLLVREAEAPQEQTT
jgi:hypothetical protein